MWQHLLIVLWQYFLPTILFTSIGALLVIMLVQIVYKPIVKGWQPVIFSFSLLGGIIGLFVGASKTPVIGTVLPAILTFVAALLAYLFGKENLRDWRPVLPFCIIAVLLTALYGSLMGTSVRKDFEDSEKRYKEWILHYEKVGLEVAKEGYLRILNGEKLSPEQFDPLIRQQRKDSTVE